MVFYFACAQLVPFAFLSFFLQLFIYVFISYIFTSIFLHFVIYSKIRTDRKFSCIFLRDILQFSWLFVQYPSPRMNWMSSLWNVTICLYFFILRPRIFLLFLVSFPLFAAINTSLSFRLNPSTFTGVPSTLLVYLCHETINCTFFPSLPLSLMAVKILFPSGKHGRLKLTLQAPYNAPHWRVVPPRAPLGLPY